MSGTSKLQLIEDKMVEFISNIDSEPYNYVWNKQVNERDMAKQDFPSAVIYFEGEECLDEQDGSWSGAYYLGATFRIEVRTRLDSEYSNPVVEIRKDLYKCLDDLKMLFGRNWNLDGTCDTIMFRGATIEEEPSGDIFIPSKLITNWYIRYEVSRVDPTITAQ